VGFVEGVKQEQQPFRGAHSRDEVGIDCRPGSVVVFADVTVEVTTDKERRLRASGQAPERRSGGEVGLR